MWHALLSVSLLELVLGVGGLGSQEVAERRRTNAKQRESRKSARRIFWLVVGPMRRRGGGGGLTSKHWEGSVIHPTEARTKNEESREHGQRTSSL